MRVKLQQSGTTVTGLHIGSANVRQFFPASLNQIYIEIEHLRICCDLEADFWRTRPSICDARLNSWLSAKTHLKPEGSEIALDLAPICDDAFRLRVLLRPYKSRATQEVAAV